MLTKGKIDPSKVALGCRPMESAEDMLTCEPKYEEEGSMIPMSNEGPITLQRVQPNKYRIVAGGSDLTTEKIEALKKAMEKTELNI